MKLLIVKHGALGDVVRTSYFARPLREKWGSALRLSWLTAAASAPLLRFHPDIDDLYTSFDEARSLEYDKIYSLDDEIDVLRSVAGLRTTSITGAMLVDDQPSYTDDSARWFDMGLLSRFGKARADELKKANQAGHAEIFGELFGVTCSRPEFHGNPCLEQWARVEFGPLRPLIGINAFAGGRWPSKELPPQELDRLVDRILAGDSPFGRDCTVVLIGAGPDRLRNLALQARRPGSRIAVPDTDDSVLRLAAVVGQLDALITSDSLAMHLAISQRVPTLAFFAPTSAQEIDAFGVLTKITSNSPDYCSYRKDADNRSITADRLIRQAAKLKLGSHGADEKRNSED